MNCISPIHSCSSSLLIWVGSAAHLAELLVFGSYPQWYPFNPSDCLPVIPLLIGLISIHHPWLFQTHQPSNSTLQLWTMPHDIIPGLCPGNLFVDVSLEPVWHPNTRFQTENSYVNLRLYFVWKALNFCLFGCTISTEYWCSRMWILLKWKEVKHLFTLLNHDTSAYPCWHQLNHRI